MDPRITLASNLETYSDLINWYFVRLFEIASIEEFILFFYNKLAKL